MNNVAAAFPNRELHVILDNLNTHKRNEQWLNKHPKVHFHFTPTSASWLNQVEIWFSILQGQSLSGTSFTSLEQLKGHINAFIKAYNDKAEPSIWTKKKGPSTPVQGAPYHSALIPGTRLVSVAKGKIVRQNRHF
jgi:DDE superfamily endonuclease